MSTSVSLLEYQEAGGDALALPLLSSSVISEPSAPVIIGISEDEVARQIQIERDAATADADRRVRIEGERVNQKGREKVAEVLKEFSNERAEYFRRVEGEVVQLALSIARKILQREAVLDPTLLAALVRIALDRMQCGSVVRIRVAPENEELWRSFREVNGGSSRWEISRDDTLSLDDCIVETELGAANFGFEAQMRDVEDSFMQLLARRPDGKLHDAARV